MFNNIPRLCETLRTQGWCVCIYIKCCVSLKVCPRRSFVRAMTSYNENGDPKAMSLEKTQSNTNMTGDEDNDSPIEQVRLTVPPTDDPTQPTLTFRT